MTQESTSRLAAVWFAEVVGFHRLFDENEELARRGVHELQRIAQTECDAWGGRVVRFFDYAILSVFGSADAALGSAVRMCDGFLASPHARASGLSLRVGLDWGEVFEDPSGSIGGGAAGVALSLKSTADPGQVIMTSSTHEWLRQTSALEVEVEDLGERECRGLGVVHLFAASRGSAPGQGPDLPEGAGT